jgi:hypothetical protein
MDLRNRWNKLDSATFKGSGIINIKPPIESFRNSKEAAFKARQNPVLLQHVFDLASSAYFHMMIENQSQSIVILGESNSGKSYNMELLQNHLIDLGRGKKNKKLKIGSIVRKARKVFMVMGNRTTDHSDRGTFFHGSTHFQFSKSGKFIGVKFDLLLASQGLTSSVDGSSSFHIFYHLISSDLKSKWLLDSSNPADYGYLKGRNCSSHKGGLKSLELDLSQLGFDEQLVDNIFRLLAATLLLGNVQFSISDTRTFVSNIIVLKKVAELLGLEMERLETWMVSRNFVQNGQNVSAFLSVEDSLERRDQLARTIFSLLFQWIATFLNSRYSKSDGIFNSISLYETPSCRLYCNMIDQRTPGDLTDLLFNFANERVQSIISNLDGDSSSEYRRLIPVIETVSSSNYDDIISRLLEVAALDSKIGVHVANRSVKLAVTHFGDGIMQYDPSRWVTDNYSKIEDDLEYLIRGDLGYHGTNNYSLRSLFIQKAGIYSTSGNEGFAANVVNVKLVCSNDRKYLRAAFGHKDMAFI